MRSIANKILFLFLIFSFSFLAFGVPDKEAKRESLIREAQGLFSGGESERAKNKLKKALKSCDSKWEIYIRLGDIEFLTKNYPRAIHYYNQSLRHKRNNPEVYLLKGLVYYEQSKMNDAAKEFQKAKSLFQRDKNDKGVKRVEGYLKAIDCAISDKGFSIGR